MKLSDSQADIIEFMTRDIPESSVMEGGSRLMRVPAVAGSGKSLTIIEMARRCPNKRLLFLAQSRNVVDRARGTLPSNVTVCTIYEMAARHIRLTHQSKLQNARPSTRLSISAIREIFGSSTSQEINLALRILGRFYTSSGSFPEPKHIPWSDTEGEGRTKGTHPALALARDIWFSQTSRNEGTLPLTFDALIKLWTLSSPETVQLGERSRSMTIRPLGEHDIVILEEAQESTEALISFIARQTSGILMLGDPFQALRPGNPAIQNMRHPLHQRAETVFMEESWRFGPHVASVLNALTHKAGSTRKDRITGRGTSYVYGARQQEHWLRAGLHHTYIAARNASLFQMALEATRAGKSIAWVDGAMSYPLILLRDLALLAQPNSPLRIAEGFAGVQTPHLRHCKKLADARQTFERNQDNMGLELCLWVEFHNDDRLFDLCTHWIRQDDQRQEALIRGETPDRDITLCTVTRCKGHEFPRVAIANDVLNSEILTEWKTKQTNRRAINQLYTAISRTQHELALPDALLDHLSHHAWPVALSHEDEAPVDSLAESERHPYFGVFRHLLLEMTPKSRDTRRRIQPDAPTRTHKASGQDRIKERVMLDAQALSAKDPSTLRAELFGRRRKPVTPSR